MTANYPVALVHEHQPLERDGAALTRRLLATGSDADRAPEDPPAGAQGDHMNTWTITNLDLRPHAPEILASTDDARAIALMIPAGESFDDHQVHERAWVTVLAGDVEITTSAGESITGGSGLLVEFAPNERHAVHARSDARLLLLLTPWPGVDHPGAMTLEQKANARHNAAEHRANS